MQDRLLPDLAPCANIVDMTDTRLERAKEIDQNLQTMMSEMEESYKKRESDLEEFIKEKYWIELNLPNFQSYWDNRFGDRYRIGGSVRDLVIKELSSEGSTKKQIATSVGVSPRQVQRVVNRQEETSVSPEHETTPIEPTEILPAVETWNGQTSEQLAAEFKDLLETNRSVLEPSVPYDFTPDNAMSMALESASGWMEMAERVSKKEISSKMKAKIRIELEIMRDMIDMIEERL